MERLSLKCPICGTPLHTLSRRRVKRRKLSYQRYLCICDLCERQFRIDITDTLPEAEKVARDFRIEPCGHKWDSNCVIITCEDGTKVSIGKADG